MGHVSVYLTTVSENGQILTAGVQRQKQIRRYTGMKVDEIRACLKNWNEADLVKLYTLTYRKVPKT